MSRQPATVPAPASPKLARILILKPCCIGDVLLASPLVLTIRDAWPDARIEWAADSHSHAAAAGIPGVTAIVPADGCVPGAMKAAAVVSLVRGLGSRAYEMAVVPDRSRVLAWIVRAARIPVRAGLDSGGRGRSHTLRVPVDAREVRHEADVYLDIARALGLPVAHTRLAWQPTAADRAWAAEKLRSVTQRAPDGSPAPQFTVALHPGGGVNPGMTMASKRWPADRYAEVARGLLADGKHVAVLGAPSDADAVAEVVARAPGAWDWSALAGGPDSLGRVGAALELAGLYLGNDSGVAHLAGALGVPAVVVFGPTDPRRYGPLPGTGIAVSPPDGQALPGASNSLRDARRSDAILRVSVTDVSRAVRSLMNDEGRPRGAAFGNRHGA